MSSTTAAGADANAVAGAAVVAVAVAAAATSAAGSAVAAAAACGGGVDAVAATTATAAGGAEEGAGVGAGTGAGTEAGAVDTEVGRVGPSASGAGTGSTSPFQGGLPLGVSWGVPGAGNGVGDDGDSGPRPSAVGAVGVVPAAGRGLEDPLEAPEVFSREEGRPELSGEALGDSSATWQPPIDAGDRSKLSPSGSALLLAGPIDFSSFEGVFRRGSSPGSCSFPILSIIGIFSVRIPLRTSI